MTANRILPRPEFSGEQFVNDDGARISVDVSIVEQPPGLQLGLHRLEIPGAHPYLWRRNQRFAGGRLITLGEDYRVVSLAGHRYRRSGSGGDDARNRAHAFEDATRHAAQRGVVCIAGCGKAHAAGQDLISNKARLDRQHTLKARQQQPRADEQHQREGDLAGHQRPAYQPRAA